MDWFVAGVIGITMLGLAWVHWTTQARKRQEAQGAIRRRRVTHHPWSRTPEQRKAIVDGLVRAAQPWVRGDVELRAEYVHGWFAGPVLVRSMLPLPEVSATVWQTLDGRVHVTPVRQEGRVVAVLLDASNRETHQRVQRSLTMEEAQALGLSLLEMREAAVRHQALTSEGQ